MRKTLAAAVAALALLSPFASASPAAATASNNGHRGSQRVTQIPISFEVRNVNRSKVACASDGATYTVRGHLVAPSRGLRARRQPATTLYLHGLSFGEFFWNFQQAQDYNYAVDEARLGHSSVVIDRIGYNSSDKPNGFQVCVGSRADMAHQMVLALRSGKYHLDGRAAPQFRKVALAGHSYGGQIAQVEAYSFGDIDGLVVMGYSDRVQSDLLKQNAAYAADVCATGGLRVGATGPAGYAPFGPPEGAPAALFATAEPSVESAAVQQLTIDPCGDTAYFNQAVDVDLANLASVTVPVLVVAGSSDALFPPPAVPDQAALFTGSPRVEQTTLPGIAHAIALERIYELGDISPLAKWLRTQTK